MSLSEEELQRVTDLRQSYSSLEGFLLPMEPYFEFFPGFKSRLFKALANASLEDSLQSLQTQGVLPDLDPTDFSKIVELWNSELFRVYLDAIGFTPPPQATLSQTLKSPVNEIEEFRQRCDRLEALYGLIDHWESVVQKTCPELYLLPFLTDEQQQGCDIACGWGRGALTVLSRSPARRVHCCDSSAESLQQLHELAVRDGLGGHIETHSCLLPNLPLANSSQDFAVGFDIFELLPDSVLHPLLDEILRVCKLSAVLYFKVTLHAFQPTLGQVQNFTPRKVQSLFEGRSVQGKSMRLELHHRQAPEHFTFRVVTTPRDESPSSGARTPGESRAALLRRLRRR